MSINTSGKWWIGSEPIDLKEYLEAYSADSDKVHESRLARCSCGSEVFRLEADDDDGVAKRTCSQRSAEHFICDSEEYWEDAEPKAWRCFECGTEDANVGVGFSLYDDDGEVRWLYVGERCSRCGVLGCFAGWKIAYAPSKQLFDQV